MDSTETPYLDICVDDLEEGPPPEPLSAKELFLQKNPGLDPEDFDMLEEKQKKAFYKKAKKMLKEYQKATGYEDSQPPRSSRKKRRRSEQLPEDPIENEPEEEKELSAYDQHLQTMKRSKKKKTSALDEDNLELDQVARQFVEEMQAAAAEDHLRVKEHKPVKHVMNMLERTTKQITRSKMIGPLLNSGLLEALRDWLVPYATGDLPPLHLRDRLYDCFQRMQLHRREGIQGHFLACEERAKEEGKEGFCKAVMNLAIHKQESASNRAKLRKLVQDWVRPLIGKEIDFNPYGEMSQHQVDQTNEKRRVMRAQARERRSTMDRLVGTRTRARVPERPYFDFRKPVEAKSIDAQEKAVNEKHKGIIKKFQYMKNSSNKSRAQLTTVSLTGKGRKHVF